MVVPCTLKCSLVRYIFPTGLKLDGQNIVLRYFTTYLFLVLHATALNMHCSRVDLDGNISSLSSFYFLPHILGIGACSGEIADVV